jgi:hypothetical protein
MSMSGPTGIGARSTSSPPSPAPGSAPRYQPAVADRDRPRSGTLDSLTHRRWVTIVARAVLLLALIGALTALAVGVVVIVVALVLAATAG